MCEFSGKLIAWMDRELPAEEAAEVERHMEACPECRSNLDAYQRVSSELNAYCEEAIASNVNRGVLRWVPIASATGAVAALVGLILVLPRTRVEPPTVRLPQITVAAAPAAVAKIVSAPVRSFHGGRRREVVAPVQIQNAISAPARSENAYFSPDEPVIQIAIPADEMFPPGAIPEGVHFAADLTIAADGSAERLRLRPRLAGFERRSTQP